MQLPDVPLPARLRAVPELAPFQAHAGALDRSFVGMTVAVSTGAAVIAGPLTSFTESMTEGKARLLLRIGTDDTIGELTLGVHPSYPVTVLPEGHTLAVTATPRER